MEKEEEGNPILTAAIKALQERVHELESANGAFRRETSLLRLKLNDNIFRQTENENNNIMDADNTVQMLSSAGETLRELRQIKRENYLLREEASKQEEILGKLLRANNELSFQNKLLLEKYQNYQSLQAEYETLILQILSPSQLPQNVKLDVIFVKSANTKNTHSMPAKLQMLIKKLRSLPTDFSSQRIETKRAILSALMEVREKIDELNYEISELKENHPSESAQKRIKHMLDSRINYIAVLVQESNKFLCF